MRPLLVFFVVSASCAPHQEALPVGELCVQGDAAEGAVTFPVAAALRVRLGVSRDVCRPACDTLVSPPCTLVRDGDTFRVQGRIVVEVDCHGQDPVPVCSAPAIECTTGPVGAGVYTVTDGVRSVTVRVPETRANGQSRICSP